MSMLVRGGRWGSTNPRSSASRGRVREHQSEPLDDGMYTDSIALVAVFHQSFIQFINNPSSLSPLQTMLMFALCNANRR